MRQWKAAQAGDWATVKAEQDRLNEISHIWDVTSGVQGYAGGVGAFKTAMNLMGIFDSPTMPRPEPRPQKQDGAHYRQPGTP